MKYIKMLMVSAVLTAALAGCATQTGTTEDYIGTDAAAALALQESGIAEADAVMKRTDLDTKNGIAYYEVEFTSDGYEYEYDIDAITGVVIESKSEAVKDGAQTQTDTQTAETSNQSATAASGEKITEADAKEIALSHAGLSSDEATFVKTKFERDDGRLKYEVEFYSSDYKEYDYEIDAETGEIISYDQDAEYYDGKTSDTKITADEAKNIALAQVSGATLDDIYEFETDYDDGRLEYEGTIYYSGMEYEFTIDGYSGAIRSWEAEPIKD